MLCAENTDRIDGKGMEVILLLKHRGVCGVKVVAGVGLINMCWKA